MFDMRKLRKYAQAQDQVQAKKQEKAPHLMMDDAHSHSKNAQAKKDEQLVLDSKQTLANSIAVFQEQQIVSEAIELFNEWLSTEDSDLDEGEGLGDRLYGLMVGLADDNKDGEISADESNLINIGLNAIADYMIEKGVSEENAETLLTEFDNEVANNVRELILGAIPEGDDDFYADIEKVVFSPAENQSILDSVMLDDVSAKQNLTLDAAYRKTYAIRNGKKLRINKRISGKVRLSAKQKQAIRKAQRKAFTGVAKMRRLKSFRLRKRLGM